MAYETKDGDGVLFPKSDKKTDKHPDWSGNIRLAGVDYWLSGWNKTSDKGDRISLAAKVKDSQPQPNKAEAALKATFPETSEEDIGF